MGDADARPIVHGDGLIFRLETVWSRLLDTPRFLIETEYAVPPAFQEIVGLDEIVTSSLCNRAMEQTLTLGHARPDIIQAMAASQLGAMGDVNLPVMEITGSGEIVGLPDGDARIGLRVIDCKLAAEASEAHFAEIAYYCMTLAAWLGATVDQDGRVLSERFFVRADAAVWPGRHGGSTMETRLREAEAAGREPTDVENLAAFELDLDYLPAPVFTARVRRFFEADLRDALTPEDWRAIGYHVDSRCVGCEFLGHHWNRRHEDDAPEADPNRLLYCKPMARADGHISRIPGITDGARRILESQHVRTVADIAAMSPGDAIFDGHGSLKGIRALAGTRAQVLGSRTATVVPAAGSTAVLPKHVDVKIHIVVEFDPASGITGCFGWMVEHRGLTGNQARVAEVQSKSVDAERNALVAMLNAIQQSLALALQQVWTWRDGTPRRPTAQVYFWDRIGYEHLRRVIGRHLSFLVGAPQLRDLAWLFPPEQVIPNPETLSLRSPVSIVSDAFRALTAADSPHFYSLLGCARLFHPQRLAALADYVRFRVNPVYEDPLTDYVPVERIHEIWQDPAEINARNLRRTVRGLRPLPIPSDVRDELRRTTVVKLRALSAVTERLTADLRVGLEASAPELQDITTAGRVESGISADGLVWLAHRKLQAASEQFENDMLRALTSEQREAKFASARVRRLLVGTERANALADLGLADVGGDRLVFEIAEGSRDAKLKPGMGWSLMTEALVPLQYATVSSMLRPGSNVHALLPRGFVADLAGVDPWHLKKRFFEVMKVNIAAIDRSRRRVAVDLDTYARAAGVPISRLAINHGLMVLPQAEDSHPDEWGIIDPVVTDFSTSKIQEALAGMGNPPLAVARPRVGMARLPQVLGPRPGARGPRQTPSNPVEPFIWDARGLSTTPSRFTATAGLANAAIEAHRLTQTQRRALVQAVTLRLSLIWGPPGTGKSFTCEAMLGCLAEWARTTGQRIRMLVTGPTWTAIDNVAKRMPARLRRFMAEDEFAIYRLKSSQGDDAAVAAELRDFVCPTDQTAPRFQSLVNDLAVGPPVVLVAATSHQVANLVRKCGLSPNNKLRADLFDFVLVDEASQMDVAHAIMAFSSVAPEATITVVGDDKQMPPIQPVPPPKGLEKMVGSIYDYYRNEGTAADEVIPTMLDRSYRSNRDIVEFVREAGYGPGLQAVNPDQRLRLLGSVPIAEPAGWPVDLEWSPAWERILDPEEPLVAVLHADDMSSQSNEGEAHAVAALVRSLWGRLAGMTGGPPNALGTNDPMDLETFLRSGIGVVTPHRAQQATVISLLEHALPRGPGRAALYEAVDTVERFQGQERLVMIASLGLGDVDQIRGEEEFLYSLNRFNVIASRAQAKFILLASRPLIDHIPSDPVVMRQSALIKHYADGHLRQVRRENLPRLGPCEIRTRVR
ncbi:hypothetical protein EJV46_15725 [Roseococcus sp. SYP-B2431]|uniref:bifunctional RecB family nuclease/DEAD/DEAH box helicase n=1 Tax=Roseococcus sp. SYP-B2431 TaxID=2496640 RepID=UPI00103BE7DD|nr:AAA domain-containing protein [Roseococcus sp. SYP-B2431]TCH97572.1 hypothetical protein EJV46_15725 [Roseococcus sp. SYP-B2431]